LAGIFSTASKQLSALISSLAATQLESDVGDYLSLSLPNVIVEIQVQPDLSESFDKDR